MLYDNLNIGNGVGNFLINPVSAVNLFLRGFTASSELKLVYND